MRRLRALFWRAAGTFGMGRSDRELVEELGLKRADEELPCPRRPWRWAAIDDPGSRGDDVSGVAPEALHAEVAGDAAPRELAEDLPHASEVLAVSDAAAPVASGAEVVGETAMEFSG